MNRQRAYWPLDDAPLRDGDSGFVGVDERMEPHLLPPGMVASATNCRFRAGRVEPRAGITILPWMKGDGRTPFTTTGAMAVFQVAPPAAYVDLVGGVGVFAPDGTSDAVIGLRFGEVQTINYVSIFLDGSGTDFWSSGNAAQPPVGIVVNGVLANTDYTATLGLAAQEVQLVFSLGAFSLAGDLHGHTLTIIVNTAAGGDVTTYLSIPAPASLVPCEDPCTGSYPATFDFLCEGGASSGSFAQNVPILMTQYTVGDLARYQGYGGDFTFTGLAGFHSDGHVRLRKDYPGYSGHWVFVIALDDVPPGNPNGDCVADGGPITACDMLGSQSGPTYPGYISGDMYLNLFTVV